MNLKKNITLSLISVVLFLCSFIGIVIGLNEADIIKESNNAEHIYRNEYNEKTAAAVAGISSASLDIETDSQFLSYSGSETFYFADVSCDRLVSAADKPFFQIVLKQTQLTVGFWAGPPKFTSVKITVTSPMGRISEYKFEDGKKNKGTDLSGVLFGNEVLKEDGIYTVKASGTISAGADTSQDKSFTFVYDSTPPTGSLNITNGGITNSTVDFSADEGKLYYSSSFADIPSGADTFHSENTIRFSESAQNYYRLNLVDAAGNSSQYTFIIDKTAPTLTLSGVAVDGYTSGSVSASWSTAVGGITAQRVSYADTLTVKYSFSTGATFPTTAATNYTAGTELTEAGNYLLTIEDSAGNKTQYKFTIDKSAPKLTLSGVAENGFTNSSVTASWSTSASGVSGQRANSGDRLTIKYSYNTGATFPTSAKNSYVADYTVLTAAGNYLLVIADKAGNSTSYKFTIDKSAPWLSLSGVAENGFTNDTVRAVWTTSVSGITGQLSNSFDGLTVKYAYNTGSVFPSSANTSYSASSDLSAVGNYLLEITDKAGNSRKYKFTIDKTAPTLTLNGLTDGFTNGSVTASWIASNSGVKGQISNENDTLAAKYSRSTGAAFPTSADTNYTAGTELTEAGNYLLTIEDKAGNFNRYTFTIDKSAPTLSLSGVIVGGITKSNVTASWSTSANGISGQLSNSLDRLMVKYSYSGGLQFPTTATHDYLNGNLTAEGNYLLIITDKAGNSTSYKFTIDKTAPSVTVMPELYTNRVVSYAADDLHGVASVEFRLNGGDIGSNTGSSITIEPVPSNFGVWEIRAIDTVGNVSEWETVNLLIRSNFGNLEDARNEYKTAAWYTVTLSSKNFTSVAGKYSFESYDAALKFALEKEWQYRVVTLSNGTWSYTNIANSSVTQIYSSRAELEAAIDKYARANVSARTVLRTSGGSYYSPVDENGILRPDALTRQNIALPSILSQYADLPLILINHDYIFRTPEEVLAGNTSSFVLSYISDGITLQPGLSKTFSYGSSIKSMLEKHDAWRQGYYLVREIDLCGNVDEYIIYLDLDTPSLSAEAYSGEIAATVILDAAYTASHKDVMLYTGLKLERLTDNMDEFAMLAINGRGLTDAVYLDGDELPYLCYENGYYGRYTITLYDRSYNALSFDVTIAGAAPKIGHSSLTNDTRCRITITVSDANNAITSVNFYKVSYAGEFTQMYVDDDGVAISPLTLEYSLRTGGKYVVAVTDVFGREIQSEPLFYMKGLPVGTLGGVKENGITNETVTFQYENTNKIIIYVFDGGRWVTADDKAVIEERSGYNTATIAATVQNSYQYKIFLYVPEDMNLFVEYIFEIDAIPPVVEIMTDEGRVEAETVTRLPFRIGWSEYGYSVYYYNKSGSMGELAKGKYTKETVLSKAGTYVFEIADAAGNLITFNVTLDNVVSYTLEGSYSLSDGSSYISKNSITLSVTEITSKWECVSSNGIIPDNGQKITTDGTYRFHIEDLYGNILEITLIIDNLPPEPVILTVDGVMLGKNGRTNKAFNVTCEESNVVIKNSLDGRTYTLYDGACIEAEGRHYFNLTDRMGNAITYWIDLDKTVDFTVSGKYLQLDDGYIAQYITVTVDEEYSAFNAVSSNGVIAELGKRITAEGVYTLTITDLAGNVAEVVIIIDLTPPKPIITTVSGKPIQPNGKTNEAFAVACGEPDASLYLEVGGSYKAYEGEQMNLSGKYTFSVRDAIGNELTFTVAIDGGVSYDIGGKFVTDDKGRYVSNSWLIFTVTEEYTSFVVMSDNGRTFVSGEKIIYEGVYSVTVTDIAGNVETVGLIIDLTPPTPIIKTSSGEELTPNGRTKEAFKVENAEETVLLELSLNGQSYNLYDSSLLSEPATYYFRLTDLAGNSLVFTILFDSGVDFTVSGTYKIDEQGRYVTSSGITVALREQYNVFDVVSSNGVLFGAGEKVTDEGVYTLTIIDLAGNSAQLVIVVDKTPPEPLILTVDGVMLEKNGKTNEAFKVDCVEQYASVYWSRRDADYILYDGASIEAEGIYYFKFVDFIGNSTVFSVTVDKTVNYTLKGLYKTVGENDYATNTGVVLSVDEPYTIFDVKTEDGQAVVLGEKIVREGRYQITIIDAVGNVALINLHIDYTAPVISLDGAVPDGITGQNVKVLIDDFKTAYYQIYGSSERVALTESTVFAVAGSYVVVAEDYAGNRSSATFTIDGEVSLTVSPAIIPNQLITGSIEYNFKEKMSSCLLVRNGGESIAFNGGRITDEGVYTLNVIDMYGNMAVYTWTILPPAAREYSFELPENVTLSVLKDGSVYIGGIIGNRIELQDNGSYELKFDAGDTEYTLSLTVDNIKPTVAITQEKNRVVIAQPSKQNVTFELTLNGKAVNFEMGKALTAVGDYMLTVTDEFGNQNVYTFSLNYMNTFSIAIIAIASVTVCGIAAVMITTRIKQKVK